MKVTIDRINEFTRNFKRLSKKYKSLKADYSLFLQRLEEDPLAGVDLGGGTHKVRMAIASKGKGKSGGARVITYVVERDGDDYRVTLLTIYDKSEMDSVSDNFIKGLVNQVEAESFSDESI